MKTGANQVSNNPSSTKRWFSQFITHLVLLVIFATSFHTVITPNQNIERYELRWRPAVAAACFGRLGVINFDHLDQTTAANAEKKLVTFLANRNTDPYTCADLPEATQLLSYQDGSNNNLRGFWRNQIGLHLVTGYLFRIIGFNWDIVVGLASLLASLVTLALFKIANRFVAPMAALGIAGVASFAAMNLELTSVIRDYAKTPFILFGFLMLVRIITQADVSARKFYIQCIGLGSLLGAGLMFRTDLLATFALSLMILSLFPHSKRPLSMVATPLAITLPFLAFYIPSNIVFAIEYDAIGHVLNLGLSDRALNNAGWGFHEVVFNPLYRDYASYGMIGAYGAAIGNDAVIAVNAQYASSGMQLFWETLLTFPFDLIGRCFTIFLDVTRAGLVYPFEAGKDVYMGVMTLISLSFYAYAFAHHRRLFYVTLFYFLGYSCVVSMQYIERHYFFLHMLWFTFVSAGALHFAWELSGKNRLVRKYLIAGTLTRTLTAAGWTLPALLLALGVFIVAGAYGVQKQRVYAWKQAVLSQPVIPVVANIVPEGTVPGSPAPTSTEDAHVIDLNAPWSDFSGATRPSLDYTQTQLEEPFGGYLEVRFHSSATCGESVGRFWAMYAARSYAWNLSHVVNMAFDETQERSYFFPVFFSEPAQFSRLTFNAPGSSCLEGLYWVRNFQNLRLPVAFSSMRQAL